MTDRHHSPPRIQVGAAGVCVRPDAQSRCHEKPRATLFTPQPGSPSHCHSSLCGGVDNAYVPTG